MDFSIRLANKNILIHSIYTGVYNTCKDYLIEYDSEPDITVFSSEALIKDEFDRSQKTSKPIYSLKSAERFLVQRIISESLLQYDTVLMHGAVIAIGDTAYMFSGKSGVGKTTHIKQWLDRLSDCYVVNGDKPFVVIHPNNVYACGTPWCGKENMGKNTIVPLQSIVFMERDNENTIESIPFTSAIPMLLEQTYLPTQRELVKTTLSIIMKLKNKVDFYVFHCNNYKNDSFLTAYNLLCNQTTYT